MMRNSVTLITGFRNFTWRLTHMLRWALLFLVLSIVAGWLGFGGIASSLAGFAQVSFVVFLALLLVSLVAGLVGRAESHND